MKLHSCSTKSSPPFHPPSSILNPLLPSALALFLFCGTLLLVANATVAAGSNFDSYFKAETAKISDACLSDVHSLADWQTRRPELRREAAEMLGLDPMPERTPLHPIITGKLEEKDFTVEKLCFQSRPNLYVTANLYLPKPLSTPAPTVLYLCGHVPVITNGISYGNKTAYQHHGIWFARNGYICLVMDTLQYGEILGHHRGTYDENQWWWNSRGYTPAGVETWDAIRALDYLATRPEVDTNRMGVTGRSGGGAYSWFLAALDDRVKVIAPVAGITDLQNYVVDGAVDGHCDCMFLVNTYRWDYPLLASLCAPRPLMLANSDADQLFPLGGVMRTRNAVKRIYDLYGATTNFGLVIGPGPHKDTQDLQVPVFHWFNHYLKRDDSVIEMAAVKMFSPQELKVFDKIPDDQSNTVIQDIFEPAAQTPEIPATAVEWKHLKETWMNGLRLKCFAGWPTNAEPPQMIQRFSKISNGIQYEYYEIQSETNITLPMYVMQPVGNQPRQLLLRVADSTSTNTSSNQSSISLVRDAFGTGKAADQLIQEVKSKNVAVAEFFPRGVGPAALTASRYSLTQLRRRFMLVGQTLDGMRVWDITRAVTAVRSMNKFHDIPLRLDANSNMGINSLYASLFASKIDTLSLQNIPATQKDGPDYLNVLKILDLPEAAAMAAEHCRLQIQSNQGDDWNFLRAMSSSPVANLKVEWLN